MGMTQIGGSSSVSSVGSNDFTIATSGGNNAYTLTKPYPAGVYNITFLIPDSVYDIYLVDANGNSVGYSSVASIKATGVFTSVAVMGMTANQTMTFTYAGEALATDLATLGAGAGATITSLSTASLPAQNATTNVTGTNFAANATVTFTGTDSVARAAKAVVRNSSTSLTVTRPDTMPPSASPYTLTVSNPGVPVPTATSSHILPAAVTAGGVPIWNTGTVLPYYTVGSAYATALVVSDADGAVTFSVVSGTLPTGFSLNATSGIVSGTTSQTGSVAITFRATDTGGNYSDWSTYLTQQVTITGGTATSDATYYYRTFTASGTFTFDKVPIVADVLVVAGGGGGGNTGYNGGIGGGGAGGYKAQTLTIPAGSYTVTVGAGGAAAAVGSNSSFGALLACNGGGSGGITLGGNGVAGGSGGGGSSSNGGGANGGAGIAGQGFAGGNADGNWAGGGGGGATSIGTNGIGLTRGGDGGTGATWVNGTIYAKGAPGGSAWATGSGPTTQPQPANTGFGGYYTGAGGSGIIILRFKKSAVGE